MIIWSLDFLIVILLTSLRIFKEYIFQVLVSGKDTMFNRLRPETKNRDPYILSETSVG